MILGDIRSLLVAESTITDLLPSVRHVFVEVVEEWVGDGESHVLISRLNTDPHNTVSEGLGDDRAVDIDIECRARTPTLAQTLAEAVRDYFEPLNEQVAGTSTIHAVTVQDEYDEHDNPTDGSKVGLYTTITDYLVQYR